MRWLNAMEDSSIAESFVEPMRGLNRQTSKTTESVVLEPMCWLFDWSNLCLRHKFEVCEPLPR